MGRIIDPNSHNQTRIVRPTTAARSKPAWIGNVGEPCGYCCLTLWWLDNTDYSKKLCPITFPNNKEYVKFCIDYTQSILHGINIISNYRDLSSWPGFRAIRAASRSFTQDDRGGPGVVWPSNYFPLSKFPKDSKTSGQQLCENYYEVLKLIEDRANGTFGVEGLASWSPTGHCGSQDCDCNYPCPDAATTKKVWTGQSECECASPLIEYNNECFCQGDDYDNPKKTLLITRAKDPTYAPAYPLGRCGCKEKTLDGKPTFLYAKRKEGSECPDCECKQAEVIGNDGKWYAIDTVFVPSSIAEEDPGRCECDESKNLEDWTELSKYGILRCRCKDPYVWDPKLEQCVPGSLYVDWGKVEITDVKFSESGGFEKQCPESYEQVRYTIEFTVDDLRNADWADIFINFEFSKVIPIAWYVESEAGPTDLLLRRGDINSVNYSTAVTYPSPPGGFAPPKPLPSRITIGKHYEKNNFSPGKLQDYYKRYINLKHFESSSILNKYVVIVTIDCEIQSVDDGETFGITASFTDLQAKKFNGIDYFSNIGSGSSSASHFHTYDLNCQEPTPEPTVTPTPTPTEEPPTETPS